MPTSIVSANCPIATRLRQEAVIYGQCLEPIALSRTGQARLDAHREDTSKARKLAESQPWR